MTAVARDDEVTYVRDVVVPDRPLAGAVRGLVERLRQGRPLVVLDSSGRTAPGELVLAAEMAASDAVSVDATDGTTTGISAADRARTITALSHPEAVPADFKRPGHVVPLRTWSGGLRAIAAGEELRDFARQHHLAVVTIDKIAIAATTSSVDQLSGSRRRG